MCLIKHATLTTKPSQSSTTHTLHNYRSAGAVLFSWIPYGRQTKRDRTAAKERSRTRDKTSKPFVVCCLRDSLLFASLPSLWVKPSCVFVWEKRGNPFVRVRVQAFVRVCVSSSHPFIKRQDLSSAVRKFVSFHSKRFLKRHTNNTHNQPQPPRPSLSLYL